MVVQTLHRKKQEDLVQGYPGLHSEFQDQQDYAELHKMWALPPPFLPLSGANRPGSTGTGRQSLRGHKEQTPRKGASGAPWEKGKGNEAENTKQNHWLARPKGWLLKNAQAAGQWWCTPLIPALGRQRQADFWVRGQPGLQSEFQDSQGYTEKSCLKKKKERKEGRCLLRMENIWMQATSMAISENWLYLLKWNTLMVPGFPHLVTYR